MINTGFAAPSGDLFLKVVRGGGLLDRSWPTRHGMREVIEYGLPGRSLPEEISRWRAANLRHLWRGVRRVLLAEKLGIATHYGALYLEKVTGEGARIPYGLASLRVVTTAGVNAITDAFDNTFELELFNFHGFGTGGTAEAVGDTALVTELTTQYATDNVRPTGTQSQPSANVYQTLATLDPDSDVAITEHGIFSQAATGGGTLLDRTLFSVINLSGAGGDTLQATYQFTTTAGS